ncbi:MAG: hypothetical protein IJP31_09995 [Lachnospiraceae bacterium]|nr:hypothetical protein [Lachnospiraceae bacterium]
MKFSEDILKKFNLAPEEEKEPVNIMQISEMLQLLKICAERIIQKSEKYMESTNADEQLDCMDIVTVKLNDFTQVFKDLVIFMRKEEGSYKGGTSLRYCINSYNTFEFHQTESEKILLRELLLRNEITHDYFNRELHQQKLIWIMRNCYKGSLDIHDNLKDYCSEHGLLTKYVDKNSLFG